MTDDGLFPEDTLEHVPLPFRRQQPLYRASVQLVVRGHYPFTTWDDPETFFENVDDVESTVSDDWDSEVEYDDSHYTVIEMQNEDGSWGPVDYDRIAEHDERENPRGPEEDG